MENYAGKHPQMIQHFRHHDSIKFFETDPDPLVASIASILRRDRRDQAACLSSIVYQLLADGRSPSAIFEALVTLDEGLAARGASVPRALKLSPLVAEVMRHAVETMRLEVDEQRASDAASITLTGRKTAAAAPPLWISREPFLRFCDRLLGVVQKTRIKEVALYLPDNDHHNPELMPLLRLLIEDLEAQQIRVVVHEATALERSPKER